MAALRSICYQTRDLLECLLSDTELKRNDFTIRVDGGMSKNKSYDAIIIGYHSSKKLKGP
jgi:Glycerol kinase